MESIQNQAGSSSASIGSEMGKGESPISSNDFADPVGFMSDFVNVLMNENEYNFVLQDQDVESHQLGDPAGLLGVVLWHAEKRVRLAYTGDETVANDGATLNVYFVEDVDSVLGVRPMIGELSQRSPLPCFVVDIIDEAYKHNLVSRNTASLDNLIEDFKRDYEAGIIPLMEVGSSRLPEPGSLG